MVNNIGNMGGRPDLGRYPVQRPSRLEGDGPDPAAAANGAGAGRPADLGRSPVQRPVGPELAGGAAGAGTAPGDPGAVVETGAGRRTDPARFPVQRPLPAGMLSEADGPNALGGAKTLAAGMAAAGPPVAIDKVASIRAAIADGRYHIDPALIAERMIALDLMGRK